MDLLTLGHSSFRRPFKWTIGLLPAIALVIASGCSKTPDTANSTASADVPTTEVVTANKPVVETTKDISSSDLDFSDLADNDSASKSNEKAQDSTSDSAVLEAKLLGVRRLTENYADGRAKKRWQSKVYSDNSKVKHGDYVEFHRDGETEFINGQYEDGLRVGDWVYRHSNGEIAKQGAYALDKPDGTWKKFRKDGTLDRVSAYRNGKKHGKWEIYRKDGQTIEREQYYQDDVATGMWKTYHENGQVGVQAQHVDGKIDGMVRRWYPNGDKLSEENFKAGKRDGAFTTWTEDGQVKQKIEFKNGRAVKRPS